METSKKNSPTKKRSGDNPSIILPKLLNSLESASPTIQGFWSQLEEAIQKCHEQGNLGLSIPQAGSNQKKDIREGSPLHLASNIPDIRPLEMMLNRITRPTEREVLLARDVHGSTPLHWAALKGYYTTIEILCKKFQELDSKAPPSDRLGVKHILDATDKSGWTPLHFGAYKENIMSVKELLSHGANPDIKTPHGETPADVTSKLKLSGDGETITELLNKESQRREVRRAIKKYIAKTKKINNPKLSASPYL
jgi:ankyrin repeat protein